MTNIEIIKNFITDNNLTFQGEDSGLNSDCVILSGFALYRDIDDVTELYPLIEELSDYNPEYQKELDRVFTYAEDHNYENYWCTKKAKSSYKFTPITL